MINSSTSIAEENIFRLPLKEGTRALTFDTLNRYSDFRQSKRFFTSIKWRKISFYKEFLTIGVTLNDEEEERVYIKVTESDLLVSCTVDTTDCYLSRHAYFMLYQMMPLSSSVEFQDYYWTGFFDADGHSKYLNIKFDKGELTIMPKLRYKNIYRPNQRLPSIPIDVAKRKVTSVILPKRPPAETDAIIGFSLANTSLDKWHSNHFPFLVPYSGKLNKAMNSVKSFNKYILDTTDLPDIKIDSIHQQLLHICFEMKKIALVKYYSNYDTELENEQKKETNRENFGKLLELWLQALPMLTGNPYTHYEYTYGMRNVKGKPLKKYMEPCLISDEVPEVCFLWKDREDYFKLELRILLNGKIYDITSSTYFSFFICIPGHPHKYYFLQSVTECDLLTFFSKREYQLLILKHHYDSYCDEFITSLRRIFRFYKR